MKYGIDFVFNVNDLCIVTLYNVLQVICRTQIEYIAALKPPISSNQKQVLIHFIF